MVTHDIFVEPIASCRDYGKMNHPAASGWGINTDFNFSFAASGGELTRRD